MVPIHATSDLHVNVAIASFFMVIVVFNDVVWEELEGHSHVLVSIERRFKIHVFISAPLNLAPGVLITLFRIIFAETLSDVHVVRSYG